MVQQSDKQQPVLVALETHELISCYTQQARLPREVNLLGLLVPTQGRGVAKLP